MIPEQNQSRGMADKISLPVLLPSPSPPFKPIVQHPLTQNESFPVISLLQQLLSNRPPQRDHSTPKPNFDPTANETQQKINKYLVLDCPSRPPPIIKDAPDEIVDLNSQLGSNTCKINPSDISLRTSRKQRLGRYHGEKKRKPWKNELSQSGEFILTPS